MGVDRVTLELVDNRLDETVREMQYAIFRTGYSAIIRESKDTSASVTTRDGRVVGQQFQHPLHLGVFPPAVRAVNDRYGPDGIQEGDVFIMNDPYVSGSPHAQDVIVANPVFDDGEIVAFTLNIAHKTDLGGLVPGTSSGAAREIYHEGLQIPPIRFERGGEESADVAAIIRNNSRVPDVTIGDIRGQVGCTKIGAQKLGELFTEFGVDTVLAAFDGLLDSTRSHLEEAVSAWRAAEFEGQVTMDISHAGNNDAVRMVLRVDTAGERPVFDFTGSDDQTELPVNIGPNLVRTACHYGLVGLTDPSIPFNSGVEEACEVVTREGSVLDPLRPAPVNQYVYPLRTVTRLVLRTLSAFAFDEPDGAVGDDGGSGSLGYGGGGSVQYEIVSSSYGGTARGDGATGVSTHLVNSEVAPIEIVESESPVRIERFEVIPDSEGAGTHRGGFGIRREYAPLAEVTFTYRAKTSHQEPPRGAGDGEDAPRPGACVVTKGDEERRLSTVSGSVRLGPGDRIRVELPGGGGYGDPKQRDPAAVLVDYRDGFVTRARAAETYGAQVDD